MGYGWSASRVECAGEAARGRRWTKSGAGQRPQRAAPDDFARASSTKASIVTRSGAWLGPTRGTSTRRRRSVGTTGLRDYGTTGLRDYGTTGLRDYGTTGLRRRRARRTRTMTSCEEAGGRCRASGRRSARRAALCIAHGP
ncbi:hypothetical protein BURPS1655_E0220 [Burkholderia pseudomallei 1655]|nr:hypothetical protein BURPS1655_E0220 [Burkholderia pseudomallei 1655]